MMLEHSELPTELDQLASYALTALTDPGAIPPPWVYDVERAERRATDPDEDPRADFAVGCLNRLIGLVNPAELDRENAAQALNVLGSHIEEVRGRIEGELIDHAGSEDERHGLAEVSETIVGALDAIDAAVAALTRETGTECGCGPIPGVLWPWQTGGDNSHDWIERCDECATFPTDVHAASALAAHLGRPYAFAENESAGRQCPYIDKEGDR
jgi:hypothetical protein